MEKETRVIAVDGPRGEMGAGGWVERVECREGEECGWEEVNRNTNEMFKNAIK